MKNTVEINEHDIELSQTGTLEEMEEENDNPVSSISSEQQKKSKKGQSALIFTEPFFKIVSKRS